MRVVDLFCTAVVGIGVVGILVVCIGGVGISGVGICGVGLARWPFCPLSCLLCSFLVHGCLQTGAWAWVAQTRAAARGSTACGAGITSPLWHMSWHHTLVMVFASSLRIDGAFELGHWTVDPEPPKGVEHRTGGGQVFSATFGSFRSPPVPPPQSCLSAVHLPRTDRTCLTTSTCSTRISR